MKNRFLVIVAAVAIAGATTTGCATRRYVRNRTDPLSQQTAELDKRTSENAQKIGALDEKTTREISRVEEETKAADSHANEANQKAAEGIAKATQAQQAADNARTLAENSVAKTGQLAKYVDNLDNYQLATSKTVYFGFDKSTLDDEAKQALNDLAQSLANMKKYVIEVQGFTDVTGDAAYNYSLSEKRAAAVVRYLTEKFNIPVYRVHEIGFGKDVPAQASTRREARKLSRRVEIKVYTVPELPQTALSTPQGQSPTQPAPAANQP